MPAAKLVTRLITPHSKIENPGWDFHAVWMPGRTEYRDAIGRRGSNTYRFAVVECNNVDCPFQALVRESDLEHLIAEAIKENHG